MWRPVAELIGGSDEDQLRRLVKAHYVVAALEGLLAFASIANIMIALAMIRGETLELFPIPPNEFYGMQVLTSGINYLIVGLVLGPLTFLAGRRLAERRSRKFCLIIAVLNCFVFVPFGTALGLLTVVVLVRPSVRAVFEENDA